MKRQYRSIINWLRAAIKNEDTVTAVEVAKQLLPLLGQLRIEAEPPVFYYRDDKETRSQCTAMSIHRLVIGQEPVGEWIRQSIGGPGLDLSHPEPGRRWRSIPRSAGTSSSSGRCWRFGVWRTMPLRSLRRIKNDIFRRAASSNWETEPLAQAKVGEVI